MADKKKPAAKKKASQTPFLERRAAVEAARKPRKS